jgi:protein-L-isoaspartate(D-aspartate) O-methyltransferase
MGTSDNTASAPRASSQSTNLGAVNGDTIEETSAPAERLRNALVDEVIEQGRVRTPCVETALRTVPRHVFLPGVSVEEAYANTMVDTKYDGSGAAISCASQPGVVGLMLEQLQAEPGNKVLELGAGTGYNAGLLAHLVGERGHVTTIDVDDDIVNGARSGLAAAGIENVTVILGDGALGHAEGAPYDRIIATVGAHGVPRAWLDQLAPDGRLLVPMRLRGSVCRSIVFERRNGAWRSTGSEMNTFMPLRGIADDEQCMLPLTSDGSVTFQTSKEQGVDMEGLADVFDQPRTEAWTGVGFRAMESPEYMELWLTCTMPSGLSRMPVQKAAIDSGLLTAPYPSSTAVIDKGALTYLTRREAAERAADGAKLYEFGVVGHGPGGDELADRVAEAIRTWDLEYRSRDVQFEIKPLDTEPAEPRRGRFCFDTPINRIAIEWQ